MKSGKAGVIYVVRKEFSRHGGLYLLALIPFTYLLIFRYWPMYGVQIAFKDYRVQSGIEGSKWVGLKHILRYFNSPMFWPTIRNTLFINIYGLLCFPLPILLAIMLTYLPSAKGRKVVQMASYAPHFISTVVMVGILHHRD